MAPGRSLTREREFRRIRAHPEATSAPICVPWACVRACPWHTWHHNTGMSSLELPHTAGCVACGPFNPHGLRLSLFVDPQSGIVRTEFTPETAHIGFEAVLHGGVLSTVFDEAMVWAATW